MNSVETNYIASATQLWQTARTPNAGPGSFHEVFCRVFVRMLQVNEEAIRWELEGGRRGSLLQQHKNVRALAFVASQLDLASVPARLRPRITQHIEHIGALTKTYNARVRRGGGDRVARLCDSYKEIIDGGRGFCAAVLPHLVEDYDMKLGTAAVDK